MHNYAVTHSHIILWGEEDSILLSSGQEVPLQSNNLICVLLQRWGVTSSHLLHCQPLRYKLAVYHPLLFIQYLPPSP